MSTKLTVSILTPGQVIFKSEADMVLIPGDDGEIGVLPEHISLVCQLSPGIVRVYSSGNKEFEIFVFGGFAKVYRNNLSIMADSISGLCDLDQDKAAKELGALEDQLLTSGDEDYLKSLFREINIRRKIIECAK